MNPNHNLPVIPFFFEELLLSSEDEDEDIAGDGNALYFRGILELRPRIQNYIEEVVDRLTQEEFRQNFRMFRETFEWVLFRIKPQISSNIIDRGRHTISPRSQLLIALWYFGTPDSYRSICGRFNIGKATALRTVRRVAHALFNIAPDLITWPHGDYLDEVINGFQQMGFPNTIGCIDGSYIKIPMPKDHGISYICRKNFSAVILQGVCDHTLKFTHCYAGETGSCHDANVLKRSEIWTYIQDRERAKFPRDTHIIGDKAYPCLPELLTPYRDNGFLTDHQKNFNYLLSSCRSTIERAFGLLQKRFRRLKDTLDVKKLQWVPIYIIACCVLHNICILQNDIFQIELLEINVDHQVNHDQNFFEEGLRGRLLMGKNKRNRICTDLGQHAN